MSDVCMRRMSAILARAHKWYTLFLRMRVPLLLLLSFAGSVMSQSRSVLVITSTPGDYLTAAGGTLADLIRQGYTVNVVQIGNDEKNSDGLNPADTRLANNREG